MYKKFRPTSEGWHKLGQTRFLKLANNIEYRKIVKKLGAQDLVLVFSQRFKRNLRNNWRYNPYSFRVMQIARMF